jgi:hypothetical protein
MTPFSFLLNWARRTTACTWAEWTPWDASRRIDLSHWMMYCRIIPRGDALERFLYLCVHSLIFRAVG